MIKRTIEGRIQSSIASRPVTLITGARQVGKTTLATAFMENGFGYVSIDNTGDMLTAQADPELFLQFHPYPLIIDEIQNAPGLFRALEHSVNSAKLANVRNYGMYILTGSQSYSMMNGVTESMAGRVSIIEMSPLSRSEILGRSEIPFSPDDLPALVKRLCFRLPAFLGGHRLLDRARTRLRRLGEGGRSGREDHRELGEHPRIRASHNLIASLQRDLGRQKGEETPQDVFLRYGAGLPFGQNRLPGDIVSELFRRPFRRDLRRQRGHQVI